MVAAVFVAPYLLPTTLRFLTGALSIEGVQVGLVTSEPWDRMPPGLAERVAAHRRIDDCLDADALTTAVASMGPVGRLLGPLEELQVPMAEARHRLGIPGLDPGTARNFRHKSRMKEVLDGAGVPCARHRLATSDEEVFGFLDKVGYPVVVKPPAGSGSRATARLEHHQQTGEWLHWNPIGPEAPLLVEEFMTGREHSFDCVFVDGTPVFWSVSRYHPAPLEVQSQSWIQWAVILPRDLDDYHQIADVGTRAITALGLRTGLVHMEWFERPDGSVAVSEAAVRPPGAQFTSLISYAHDFDLYAAWARLMILGTFDPPLTRRSVGAVYLRGQGRGKVVAVDGLDEAQAKVAGRVLEMKLPAPGETPSGHYEGDGYVIVGGDTTEEVSDAVDAILEHVSVVLG